jgi:hypothetical protein
MGVKRQKVLSHNADGNTVGDNKVKENGTENSDMSDGIRVDHLHK